MKKLILVVLLSVPTLLFGQTVLWDEDFSNEADNAVTQNGATVGGTLGGTWSVTTTPTGGAASFSKQSPFFGAAERFRVNQTGTEGVWASNVINISASPQVGISVDLVTYFASSADYIRAYYKLNGGSEVLFGELLGGGFSYNANASVVLSGTSVQIIIRGMENTAGNTLLNPNNMGFDNLTLTEITTLYSIGSTNWATNGTWSSDGGLQHTGATCGCTPNNSTNVVVGSTHNVSITAAADAVNVTVRNSGTLSIANNTDLSINRGGAINVSNTGSIVGGGVGAQIDFDYGVPNSVVVNSTNVNAISIGDIEVNGASTLTFSGTGNITVGDDFLVNEAATITNNLSGTFTITDDLNFNTTNATFINNTTITATATTDLIVNDNADDGNVFTNASTGIFNVGIINLNNGNFTLNNSGTINQSGNFSNVDTGSNGNFNNLATGIWNWSLTPNTTFDLDMITVLDCAAPGNTFNYSAAGAQRIIPCQYGNLVLSNSGAKDSNSALFSVNGNWTVSGTATFTEGTGTITLNGTTTSQTITNAAGETFRNLIINNSFGTSPQVILNNPVIISVLLTMTDGNINLNGNNITIATSGLSHALASTNGWMYGGNIVRGVPTTAIAIGTVNGFFPLGSSTDFRPFFVGKSNTGGSSGSITASHTNAATSSSVSIADSGPATIIYRSDAFWTVSTATISAGTFGIRYGGTGLGIVSSLTHMRSCLSASVIVGSAHVVATTVSTTDPRVERSTLTFGNLTNSFYVGSTNVASPLPIKLLYFQANLDHNYVNLNWATAQEINNDFFTIEKSANPELGFQSVGKLPGEGNSSVKQEYSLVDRQPYAGLSYYRLKQTDFDGKFTYSKLVAVQYDGPQFASLKVYPNPYNAYKDQLTIEISGLTGVQETPVIIFNSLGQKIANQILKVSEAGFVNETISFGSPLAPGVFVIKAGSALQLTQRLVVE